MHEKREIVRPDPVSNWKCYGSRKNCDAGTVQCSLLVTEGPQFRLLNALALMESSGIGLQVVCGWKHRVVGIATEAQIRSLPMPVHTDMCIADILR